MTPVTFAEDVASILDARGVAFDRETMRGAIAAAWPLDCTPEEWVEDYLDAARWCRQQPSKN